MSSINQVAQQYRSLCLTGVAEHLEGLLSQAEANQSSYLHFAEALVVQEQSQRNAKRIEQNKRRAGFPLSVIVKLLVVFFTLRFLQARCL